MIPEETRLQLPRIHNTLLVGSGKGGVGKTTIAVGLALALQQQGLRVGLLDTDIYGPNAPLMLGAEVESFSVTSKDENILIPQVLKGLPVMSMSFLIKEDQPVLWRGPMLNSVIQQFLFQTDWGELDYLIIDTPPGTGDVQLSLAQLLPITGAILVTTSQTAALADTRRSISQFQKLHIPILGIVENMSYFAPNDNPGKKYDLFGSKDGETIKQAFSLPLLAQFPFESNIQPSKEKTDSYTHPDLFYQLSEKVLQEVKLLKNSSGSSSL